MHSHFTIVVLLYVKPGRLEDLRRFERKVKPVIEKHGGRFELVLSATGVRGELDRPDEVHVLSFPAKVAFEAYLNDPEVLFLAEERERIVDRTVIIEGDASLLDIQK